MTKRICIVWQHRYEPRSRGTVYATSPREAQALAQIIMARGPYKIAIK